MQRRADLAGPYGFAHRMHRRVHPVVEVDHDLDATTGGGCGDRLGFGERGGKRLLAHDVLAGGNRRQHDVGMSEVRGRDGHRLDLRVGDQLAIVGVALTDAELRLHLGQRVRSCYRRPPPPRRPAGR